MIRFGTIRRSRSVTVTATRTAHARMSTSASTVKPKSTRHADRQRGEDDDSEDAEPAHRGASSVLATAILPRFTPSRERRRPAAEMLWEADVGQLRTPVTRTSPASEGGKDGVRGDESTNTGRAATRVRSRLSRRRPRCSPARPRCAGRAAPASPSRSSRRTFTAVVLALRLAGRARVAESLALRDALTGLPNRTLLDDRLEQALQRSRRTVSSFALLVIDLDGFKEVNDIRGHDAGDQVLQSDRAAARVRRPRERHRGADRRRRVRRPLARDRLRGGGEHARRTPPARAPTAVHASTAASSRSTPRSDGRSSPTTAPPPRSCWGGPTSRCS